MEFVEELKRSVDIVQVVGERVSLRRVGAGPRYTGLCPFHTEKTPSFSVHAHHQFYKCFGCGEGGDVIKFVMEIDRLTFWEAVKWLAERYGIPLPKRSEGADEETRQRGVLYEMHELALAHFRGNLHSPAGQEVRAYLANRGVSREAAEEFSIGLSLGEWSALTRILERRNYSAADLEAGGLVLKRNDGSGFFDRFRGRLMFPIHAENGKVIGFGGRALAAGDEPKYLNSAETPIYRKSYVLYNLNRAKKPIQDAGFSVLVEGYMDVIGVYSAGVKNVVATCGTALTPFQVRTLRRHSQAIVVNFDPDKAGVQATERSSTVLLEEGMHLRVLQLAGGLDPDEYVKEHGADAYTEALRKARIYFHWLAERAREKFDLKSAEGRVAAFHYLLPAIHKMPDKIERLAVANDVAEYLSIEKGMVLDEFKRAAAEKRGQRKRPVEESAPDPTELLLLHALLGGGDPRDAVAPLLRGLGAVSRFRMARIFDVALRLIEEGTAPTLSAIEGRLSDPDKQMLATVLFADELAGPGVTVEQAVACVRKLEANERQGRRDDLRQRIKAAERTGDMNEALRLNSELLMLEQK